MKSRFTQGYLVIRVPYSTIRMPYFSISVPYSTQKKSFFDFTLPSSLFRSESLYLLVVTDGRENKYPSRLPPVQGPLFSKCEGANPKKGRVTGGTIILPPVPQTPCTSAFERGDGRKGG